RTICARTPAPTRRSACRTAMAAAMARGIRHMAPRAAARTIWRAPTASACIIASRLIEAGAMTQTRSLLAAALPLLLGSVFALGAQAPRQPMSFFVTSVGLGKGGDLGGLAGADAHCQQLAAAAGSTKTWRAYLSTQARPGQPAVNARDRIGSGPWYNAKSAIISADQNELHGDTLEAA